jgi:hypothetical protein
MVGRHVDGHERLGRVEEEEVGGVHDSDRRAHGDERVLDLGDARRRRVHDAPEHRGTHRESEHERQQRAEPRQDPPPQGIAQLDRSKRFAQSDEARRHDRALLAEGREREDGETPHIGTHGEALPRNGPAKEERSQEDESGREDLGPAHERRDRLHVDGNHREERRDGKGQPPGHREREEPGREKHRRETVEQHVDDAVETGVRSVDPGLHREREEQDGR